MFFNSEANQIKAIRPLLPPGTQIKTAAIGRGSFRMTTGARNSLIAFAAVFVVGLLAGYLLYPGGIFLLYFIYTTRPQRVVAVTNEGVAVFKRSFLRNKPNGLLASLPFSSLSNQTKQATKRAVFVGINGETLALNPKKYAHLLESIPQESRA